MWFSQYISPFFVASVQQSGQAFFQRTGQSLEEQITLLLLLCGIPEEDQWMLGLPIMFGLFFILFLNAYTSVWKFLCHPFKSTNSAFKLFLRCFLWCCEQCDPFLFLIGVGLYVVLRWIWAVLLAAANAWKWFYAYIVNGSPQESIDHAEGSGPTPSAQVEDGNAQGEEATRFKALEAENTALKASLIEKEREDAKKEKKKKAASALAVRAYRVREMEREASQAHSRSTEQELRELKKKTANVTNALAEREDEIKDLKKQAKLAAKERSATNHQELVDKLASLEGQATGLRNAVEAVTAAKESAEEKSRSLETSRDVLQDQIESLTKKLNKEREELQKKNQQATSANTTSLAECEKLRKKVDALASELSSTQSKASSTGDELNEVKNQAREREKKLQTEKQLLTDQFSGVQKDVSTSRDAFNELKMQAERREKELQSEIQSLKEQVSEDQMAASTSKNDFDEFKTQAGRHEAEFHSEIQSLKKELSVAQSNVTTSNHKCEEHLKQIQSLEDQLASALNKASSAETKQGDSKNQAELDTRMDQIRNLTAELANTQNNLTLAETQYADMKSAWEGTCSTLNRCDQDRVRAVALAEEFRGNNEQGNKALAVLKQQNENGARAYEKLQRERQEIKQRLKNGEKMYLELKQELENFKVKHDEEMQRNRQSREKYDALVKDNQRKDLEIKGKEHHVKDLALRNKGIQDASKEIGKRLGIAEAALKAKDREILELKKQHTQNGNMDFESTNSTTPLPMRPETPRPVRSPSSTFRGTPLPSRQGDSPFPSPSVRNPMFLVDMERRARKEIEDGKKKIANDLAELEAKHKELEEKHQKQLKIEKLQAAKHKELEQWNERLEEEKKILQEKMENLQETKDSVDLELEMFKVYHEEDVEELKVEADQKMKNVLEDLERLNLDRKHQADRADMMKMQVDHMKGMRPELEDLRRQVHGEKAVPSTSKKRMVSASVEQRPGSPTKKERLMEEENVDGAEPVPSMSRAAPPQQPQRFQFQARGDYWNETGSAPGMPGAAPLHQQQQQVQSQAPEESPDVEANAEQGDSVIKSPKKGMEYKTPADEGYEGIGLECVDEKCTPEGSLEEKARDGNEESPKNGPVQTCATS